MPVKKSEKQELLEKLNELLQKQSQFQQEINMLQVEITQLKTEESRILTEKTDEVAKTKPTEIERIVQTKKVKTQKPSFWMQTGISSEIEKFIGENLISKIGIAVLIIGVGIGVKYAIDNNLISPLMRILLGYLVGFALNFFAIRSKKKYFNFSAVLASGAMAIHYFITYAAFTYYQLIPQPVTFGLMVFITVLTVALALYYNRQVISHFGLVGAYIVPFLLKDPDSSVVVLLVYMTIVNLGILYISTRKSWKLLNYLALISTWVIFMSWFSSKQYNDELYLSLTFSSIFFILFYLVFLSYKLILKEKLRIDDILFLLLNSGVFYFVGIIALTMSKVDHEFAGLFTLINAIIHAITAFFIFKFEKENKKLFYWTIALVLFFFYVSIPVQFNSNLTAILWAASTLALYLFGVSQKIKFFEIASYVLVIPVFFATTFNFPETDYNFWVDEINLMITPVLNFTFISSVVVAAVFSAFVYFQLKIPASEIQSFGFRNAFAIVVPVMLMVVLYFTFLNEVNLFWNNVQIKTCYEQNSDGTWIKQFEKLNPDVFRFKNIWSINYSLLFVSVLAFINFKWFKNQYLSGFNLIITGLLIMIFLTNGLTLFAELRENYLNPIQNPDFDAGVFHLLIRYISTLFFAVLLYALYKYIIPYYKTPGFKAVFEVVFSIILVVLFSSELVNILNLTGSQEVYKHGLSILWGVFSFVLVGYGIWKKNKYLRITAITLFAITLIKLFVYDLTNLNTVQKTIVFVLVGILLLVVSFMYNKYRNLIFENG